MSTYIQVHGVIEVKLETRHHRNPKESTKPFSVTVLEVKDKNGHRSIIQLFHEDPDLRIEDLKIE
jgi:hypothetical protein